MPFLSQPPQDDDPVRKESTDCSRRLELYLSGKLQDALRVSVRCSGYLTEARRCGDGCRRASQDRVVEDVECFDIDLQRKPLLDREQPMDGRVQIPVVLVL
jgi:hypothetical protein